METLHPREIELGLARVCTLQSRLDLGRVPFPIVTVGGTNGKGSTVAMLEAILDAAGYKVGAYTSPHLIDYNERVRIARTAVSDQDLCAAFARIEAVRGDTELTYFEYGTLAAVELFVHARVDVAVLEVGLGGRLDAVNAWDADVAVVSAIGIDHTDWLGPDRESIGREKAGIFRAQRPAICGDPQPPASIAQTAQQIGATLLQLDRDFHFSVEGGGWNWFGPTRTRTGLPYPAMRGEYQLRNAATVLMALDALERVSVNQNHIRLGLLNAVLPGRFQTLPGLPLRVLDVAHNAQAAQALADTLRLQTFAGRTYAVVGMLKDKPIADVVAMLAPLVDVWYVASLTATPRGASATQIEAAIRQHAPQAEIHPSDDIAVAYRAALARAQTQDRIVAFGSFYTVSAILRALQVAA